MPDQSSMTYYRTKLSSWAINSRSANAWAFSQLLGNFSQSSADYDQLLAALSKFCKSISPEPPGSNDQGVAKTLEWRVSDPAGVTRLSDIALPLPSDKVEAVIRKLGLYLASLHEKGLFCLDIAPTLTLVCRSHGEVVTVPTLPTPRLRDRAVDEDTYIAPEVSAAATAENIAPRSDFYGLGQLAWTLLTGKAGRHPAFVLPSDVAEALAPWDEFIDAMCRPHPERRPGDMRHALSLLPRKPQPSQQPADKPQVVGPPLPSPPEAKPAEVRGRFLTKHRRNVSRRGVLLGAGALGLFGLYRTFISTAGSGSALRGFADTIIRYPARSYDGAKWKRIESVDSFRGVLASNVGTLRFINVVGHDDDNLWITGHPNVDTYFFQLTNGHWDYRGQVTHSPSWNRRVLVTQRPRLLRPDKLIPCVQGGLYEVMPSGIRTIPCNQNHWHYSGPSGVIAVADDYYFHTLGWGEDNYFVIAGGKALRLSKRDNKEASVYSSEFKAPLEDYPVRSISFAASYERGRPIGLSLNRDGCKIVEFRDGRWWDRGDLSLTKGDDAVINDWTIRDVFFGSHDGRHIGFVVVCGLGGRVIFKDLNGVEEDRSVIPKQASTTLELIRVWGEHPELYWVMDATGTVWERRNGQTRVVVRGLRGSGSLDSDEGFNSAWVSPSGNVFAVDDKYLFKLS